MMYFHAFLTSTETVLGGNLCRCTGYLPIIQAIEDVHAQRSASAKLKAS